MLKIHDILRYRNPALKFNSCIPFPEYGSLKSEKENIPAYTSLICVGKKVSFFFIQRFEQVSPVEKADSLAEK